MTREAASFILANIDRRVCDDELSEALDMAIKALELQERFERYTMQDDMHLVTIKQIKQIMKGEWL